MFGDLSKYKSKEFFEKHRYIHFDTLVDLGKYEVVCVFKTTPSKFNYQNYTVFDSSDEFNSYISKCEESEYYNTDVSCGYGDKLITLSTCEYSQENGRLVVVAKKVK
jgi:sortase B